MLEVWELSPSREISLYLIRFFAFFFPADGSGTRTALSLRSGAVIVCFKPFTSLAYDLLGMILVFCENLFVEPCGEHQPLSKKTLH